MRTLLKVLCAPLFWIFQGCSPLGNPVDAEKSDNHFYNSSKSQIRYSPMGNWFELGNTAMKADVESFEVLSRFISKDNQHVFYEAYEVEHHTIDRSTFKVKNVDFMTSVGLDKHFVYTFEKTYKNKEYQVVANIVEGATPETYSRTSWDWANDGKHHFYKDTKIAADFESFEILNDYFAKDKSRAYVRNNTTFDAFEADLATLRILNESSHAMDKENVYWLSFFTKNSPKLIPISYGSDDEIAYLNRYFIKIADTIYFDGGPRSDIDALSFEIIDLSYAKDANFVYYKGNVMPNADVASFKRQEGSYQYADKNGIYKEGKLEEKKSNISE